VGCCWSDPELNPLFYKECKGMADRIISMRKQLRDLLEAGSKGRSWKHVTDQIGMFAFSGLTPEEVRCGGWLSCRLTLADVGGLGSEGDDCIALCC
jgi:hypothetical protein